jgi:serine/threonine protein phosphatase PrpC
VRYGDVLFVANAGDCRLIMDMGGDNNVRAITTDHKPDLPRERERIERTGGFVSMGSEWDVPRVNGNLAISRSMGDIYLYPHVTWVPDIYIVRIREGVNRYFVMASDGLWDTMTNDAVVEVMNTHIRQHGGALSEKALTRGCEECLMRARIKGSTDNITICAVTI